MSNLEYVDVPEEFRDGMTRCALCGVEQTGATVDHDLHEVVIHPCGCVMTS